jgi:hypothetical protein
MGFAEFIESYGFHIQTAIIFIVFLVVGALIIKFVVDKGYVNGMPLHRALVRAEGFQNGASKKEVAEGFGGIAVGAGEPQCLRTLPEAAEVYATLLERSAPGEQTDSDLEEFRLLVSKWGCLKKDLMSPSGIVEATRYVPYSTLHDRIPVADLAGQCNAKTLPSRDLDITFDTWKDRGLFLFRRLSKVSGIGGAELESLQGKLMAAWSDVYNIAQSQCIATIPSGEKMLPRDAAPYSPDEISDLGTYKGYF